MNIAQVVKIGTSEKDGTFWSQASSIATLMERDANIKTEVLDAGQASIENARRLDAGIIDLGFMASNWIGLAYRGESPFNRKIEIRNVAPANSGAMFFITRSESSLRTVRDMLGKRVAIGPEGSGMVQHIHTIFGALGISFDDFTPVYLSFEEGGAALEAGKVDAQWQCPYPNKVMQDISQRADVRVLEYEQKDLDTVLEQIAFYRRSVMPSGFFRGIEADTDQLAVVNIIAAHENTDPEIIRIVVSTMISGLNELTEINPLFLGLSGLFENLRATGPAALEFGGVPIHPGALQVYREKGFIK
jgi:TRAP transporter TAXI family solute receptor